MTSANLAGFWIAFVAAALSTYPIFRKLIKWKSSQVIHKQAPTTHQAKAGTPTMGGIIIVVGVAVALVAQLVNGQPAASALLVLLGFAAIGFLDDFIVPRMIKGKRGLGWKQKLLLEIAASTAILLDHPTVAGLASGMFIILFCANAYNFADGLDALAGGLLVLLCLGFGLAFGDWSLPLILCGAVVPFLFLNAPPAKLFMGDVGALPIGALLGLMFSRVISTGSGQVSIAALILSIMLIIELVPVPIQILSVKLRKKKVFPYTPVHHAFEQAGWPESRVLWMFLIAQALCSAGAVTVALGGHG